MRIFSLCNVYRFVNVCAVLCLYMKVVEGADQTIRHRRMRRPTIYVAATATITTSANNELVHAMTHRSSSATLYTAQMDDERDASFTVRSIVVITYRKAFGLEQSDTIFRIIGLSMALAIGRRPKNRSANDGGLHSARTVSGHAPRHSTLFHSTYNFIVSTIWIENTEWIGALVVFGRCSPHTNARTHIGSNCALQHSQYYKYIGVKFSMRT